MALGAIPGQHQAVQAVCHAVLSPILLCLELHHSNIVEHMHSICQNIREAQGVTDGMKSLLEVYANARDMEAKNRDHYLELAEVCASFEHGSVVVHSCSPAGRGAVVEKLLREGGGVFEPPLDPGEGRGVEKGALLSGTFGNFQVKRN